jgi:hypothetical protein
MVGRDKERAELASRMESDGPEFVAVVGRRRVGKTFLVRESLKDAIVFEAAGLNAGTKLEQLANFNERLARRGGSGGEPPGDWLTAFFRLERFLEEADTPPAGKKVVFLDELPWMDTPQSGFLTALEGFWNGWASARDDVMLVVCGSATSWLTHKLFRNRGGLHGRVTGRVHLQPFTLAECEQLCAQRRLGMSRKRVLDAYLVFGGVPHYFRQLRRGLSVEQNVDSLCFQPEGALRGEFEELYHSLFRKARRHVDVVTALAGRAGGLTREEVVAATGLQGAGLTRVLDDLEQCGFIRSYRDYTRPKNGRYHQLVDPFSLFHLRYLRAPDSAGASWLAATDDPARRAWTGYAFELACLLHVPQIKAGLGVAGVLSQASAWRSRHSSPAAQIDLVIDRRDETINLCEMKYRNEPFSLSRDEATSLRLKEAAFRRETGTRKDTHVTLVTPFGVLPGVHDEVMTRQVTMDDLFRPTP